MSNLQPFLTGFSARLHGSAKRKLQDIIRKSRAAFIASSIGEYALQFAPFIPASLLRKLCESKRERHFGNSTTFWAWLSQIIEQNASCSKALSMVQTWCAEAGLPVPSSETGAYMSIRLVKYRCAGRDGNARGIIIATTLLEATKHTGADLAAVYEQRWGIELKIRDVKTTLGMEDFAVRTPDMAEKTLAMLMIGYNLVKAMSQQARHGERQEHRSTGVQGGARHHRLLSRQLPGPSAARDQTHRLAHHLDGNHQHQAY